MKYLLRLAVMGKTPEIEITEAQFLDYKNARDILLNSLAIEEKYEILLSNYVSFDEQILNATTMCMVHQGTDYTGFFQIRLGLNIRLVNLLTAARLYVDQLAQNAGCCLPNDASAEGKIKDLFKNEYDTFFEYRFMEALRNYVQHRGIPVHWIQQGREEALFGTERFLEYSLELASLRSYLEEDSTFKKSVLGEIKDSVDLKLTARCYIERLSNVHSATRNMILESASNSRTLFEDAQKQYAAVYHGSLLGLSACAFSDDDEQVENVPILLE